MPVLATVAVPSSVTSVASMTIAFDGEVFYFVSTTGGGLIRARLVRTPNGLTAEPMTPLGVPYQPERITYDARHHALLLFQGYGPITVDSYSLTSHRVTRLKDIAKKGGTASAGLGYDWSRDDFALVPDTIKYLDRWNTAGTRTGRCHYPKAEPDRFPAGLASSGDGDVYLESEDDTSIVRVTAGCATPGLFTHRIVAEAAVEDDSLTCDGVTFGRPVIWLRDSGTNTMTAYGLPSGNCVLPTKTSLTLDVAHALACATLSRAEVARPVAGQRLTVGGASAVTGAGGTGCVRIPTTPGHHRVDAVFRANRSWAASAASASYDIAPPAAPPPPPRRVPRPARPVVRRAPRLTYAAPPAPPVGAAAPPAPPHPPLPQSAPQPGYGTTAVSQVVPLGAAVPQRAEAAQLAYALGDHDRTALAAGQLLAASVFAAGATVAMRRRTALAYGRR
jgi:hypothetical protein